MQTIATASDASQFLSFVPDLVGCRPTRSLVLVPLGGGRTLGAMRVDLGPDDTETAELVASTLIGMMCRVEDADALIAVVYTDESAAPVLPYRTLAEALGVRADACGLRLADALTVAADGWGSHFDAEGRVRPLDEIGPGPGAPAGTSETPGVRVTDAGASDGGAGSRSPGSAPRGDQSSGAELPDVTDEQRHEVREASAMLQRALELLTDVEAPPADGAGPITAEALEAACAFADLPLLYESALEWDAERLDPLHAALLAWCLARPSLRDIALVQWSADLALGEEAEAAQQRWEDGEEYPVSLAERLWGEGERPDSERLERALALARHIAALTPDEPGPLAVCAWLSWALGRSTHADQYARRAHALDPRHGLTDIVRSFVSAAHLPDWAFRRRTG